MGNDNCRELSYCYKQDSISIFIFVITVELLLLFFKRVLRETPQNLYILYIQYHISYISNISLYSYSLLQVLS